MKHINQILPEALKRIDQNYNANCKANAKHKRIMKELFNDQHMFKKGESNVRAN